MKIIISRDVIFDEKSTFSWNLNSVKKGIPTVFDGDEKGQQPPEDVQEEEVTPNIPAVDQNQPAASQNQPATSLQKSDRVRRRPRWMADYEVTGVDQDDDLLTHFALFSDCDPTLFEEAVKESKWRKAMDTEIAAIERNNTWEMCDLPKGQKAIGVKWVYKTKLKGNGEVDKYK